MKYAIVSTGGKQYVAREGETIEVDRLPDEIGKNVKFDQVLLTVNGTKIKVGRPTVKGAVVKGKVAAQVKGPKIVVFKYIPKERYRKKQGHRQRYTRVEIKSIDLPAPPKKTAEKKETPAKSAKPAAKSTAKPKATTKKTPSKTTAKKTTAKKTTSTSKSTKSTTGSSTKSSSSKKTSSTKKKE